MKRVSLVLMFFVGMFLSTSIFSQSVIKLNTWDEKNNEYPVEVLFDNDILNKFSGKEIAKIFKVVASQRNCNDKIVTEYDGFTIMLISGEVFVNVRYRCEYELIYKIYEISNISDNGCEIKKVTKI